MIGAVGDGERARQIALSERPDLCIMDIRMPPTFRTEGMDAALAIRAVIPDAPILMLSQYVETAHASELLDSGGTGIGYLLKDRITKIDEFFDAIRRVAAGGIVLDPEVVRRVLGRRTRTASPIDGLTERELDVLTLMAEGQSNAAIGKQLFLGERTIESHISQIFAKLGLAPEAAVHRRVLAVITYLSPANPDHAPL